MQGRLDLSAGSVADVLAGNSEVQYDGVVRAVEEV